MTIFTRSLSDSLTSLVKKIDDAVAKNEDQRMRAFVVLLTDNPSAAEADCCKPIDNERIRLTKVDVKNSGCLFICKYMSKRSVYSFYNPPLLLLTLQNRSHKGFSKTDISTPKAKELCSGL